MAEMAAWIQAIPLTEWDQQETDRLKPAMMCDPDWHGFGAVSRPVIDELMIHFPGCWPYQPMLSAVMPGDEIAPHRDQQHPKWLARVHVPLATNDSSVFGVGVKAYRMQVGRAYKVNTLEIHSVLNSGTTPRIHFMFDVRS